MPGTAEPEESEGREEQGGWGDREGRGFSPAMQPYPKGALAPEARLFRRITFLSSPPAFSESAVFPPTSAEYAPRIPDPSADNKSAPPNFPANNSCP